MMTWFIFVGDLLVMLFMILLVIWVFMVTPDEEIDESARIPLRDEEYESDLVAGRHTERTGNEKEGFSHG